MQIYRQTIISIRIFADIAVILISFSISIFLLAKQVGRIPEYNSISYMFIGLILSWFLFSKAVGIYDDFRSRDFSFELISNIRATLIQSLSAIVLLFMMKQSVYSRTFILNYSIILLISLIFQRFLFRRILNYLRSHGRNLRNILIVGAGELGKNFSEMICTNPHFGYNLIGFVDDAKKSFLNGKYLGQINELDWLLAQKRIDDVIIALPNYAEDKIEEVIKVCENHTTRVKIIPDYIKFATGKYEVSLFGIYPIFSLRCEPINQFHWRLLKRGFDTLFSLLLFITLFWWMWVLIGIIIKLNSKGPVFYKQERWGRNNEKFFAYKFRSMCTDCPETDVNGKFIQASRDDTRITKFGRFLRRTNLDELPQFINVLKGEISIVGPRPHPTPLNMESKDKVQRYMLRTLVKPGITGWAQINGYRGETREISLMQKRVDYDLWYIENWTFLLDIQIIATTVWNMLRGEANAY